MHAVRFDLTWRYWTATALLPTAGMAGRPAGVPAAIAVVLVQLGHFFWRERELASLTMQVRALFLTHRDTRRMDVPVAADDRQHCRA